MTRPAAWDSQAGASVPEDYAEPVRRFEPFDRWIEHKRDDMAIERSSWPAPRRQSWRGFESEPADEWRDEYARGGPVRSDEPERDWFFEHSAVPPNEREIESPDADKKTGHAAGRAPQQLATSPNYRGRGPKGYRPSDERILELACERLTDHPRIDASELSLSVEQGKVTIGGYVPARAMRYAAEEALVSIHGVTFVRNEIRVSEHAKLE